MKTNAKRAKLLAVLKEMGELPDGLRELRDALAG
jgi:hypothetical protein